MQSYGNGHKNIEYNKFPRFFYIFPLKYIRIQYSYSHSHRIALHLPNIRK
ncbi:hypothetical protein BLOT_014675, partial [Blomia tropicalis]